MRFFSNFFSLLKGPPFSCGFVCSAAHSNSHGINRNSITLFRMGPLKKSPHQASAQWTTLLRAMPAGSWKPPRMESARPIWAVCASTWWLPQWRFFPLKSEPPCMTTAFHPPAIHLSKEFCSIFLINSGAKRKLLGFPPGLLTGCPDSLTRDFSMCNAAGLPVPSLVSCLINWPS